MGKQKKEMFFKESKKKISDLGLKKSSAQLIPANSIVYSSRAPIGHINIVPWEYTTNQGCKSIIPIEINNIFLYWYMIYCTNEIIERASGTTFKEISATGLGETIINLPPIQEQIRIVEKITILLKKTEEFSSNFLLLRQKEEKFSELLKYSILQYAMQGKLTSQNENGESVETLLEKIRDEKEKLFVAGKLKKKDLEESIIYKSDDNSYYENIPNHWVLTTLQNIGIWGSGATPLRTNLKYYGGNIPWLKTGDLTDDYIVDISEYITELALEETSVKLNPTGSILIAMYGATIGKLGILTYPSTTNQACCACLPFKTMNNKFLFYYLMSIRKKFIDSAEGGAQPNISKIKILKTPIAFPSVSEQIKIVTKVEKILQKISTIKI